MKTEKPSYGASLASWAWKLLTLQPHQAIGNGVRTYLERWILLRLKGWGNVYVHRFVNDDEDRALHDHPWPSWSFLFWGSYIEHTQNYDPSPAQPICQETGMPASIRVDLTHTVSADGLTKWRTYSAPCFIPRSAEYRHRIELLRDKDGKPVPAWTIFVTGRWVRHWGFWCPKGFVHWRLFTDPSNSDNIGEGCGEPGSIVELKQRYRTLALKVQNEGKLTDAEVDEMMVLSKLIAVWEKSFTPTGQQRSTTTAQVRS